MSYLSRRKRALGEVVLIAAASFGIAPLVQAQHEAASLSTSFRKAAEKILPAVVAVRPAGVIGRVGPFGMPGRPWFPGGLGGMPGRAVDAVQQPGGSGIVIDAGRGLILTSEQAIAGFPRAVVIYEDGRQVESERLVRDPATELVVLAVDPRSVRVKEAEWGDSQALQLGDWVLAIGRSANQAGTVSAGIVSSRAASSQDDVLRTDAVVGSAGSGGPLINLEGRIVGINLARLDPRGWPDDFGLVIPAERARRCVNDLAEFGQVRRGYLGVMVATAGGLALDAQGQSAGLVITGMTMGSPAADAGLRVGDRIVMLDGQPIKSRDDFSKTIDEAPVGQEFRLTIERDGKRQDVKVATRPRPQGPAVPAGPFGSVGPGVRPLDRSSSRELRPWLRQGDRIIRSQGSDDQPANSPTAQPRTSAPAAIGQARAAAPGRARTCGTGSPAILTLLGCVSVPWSKSTCASSEQCEAPTEVSSSGSDSSKDGSTR